MDALIEKNNAKYKEKMAKRGALIQGINEKANNNTKKINAQYRPVPTAQPKTQEEIDAQVKKSTEYYSKNAAKPGSIASKANMVKQYNEKNNKYKCMSAFYGCKR